jgi:hypothetical protein
MNRQGIGDVVMEKGKWTFLATVAISCWALSGCGDSSSGAGTSSTNDSTYQSAARPYSPWWWWWGEDTNNPPTAYISGSTSYLSGETVTLDGSGSYDQDDDGLTFSWSQTQGPSITLSDTSNSSLTFIAPEVSETTQFSE